VPELVSKLTTAGPVKALIYSGGDAFGSPCQAAHYHGFNGIEEEVVEDIVAWMRSPAP